MEQINTEQTIRDCVVEVFMQITDKIDNLKGIGPKTADLFQKINVDTIEDLLKLYPRTYLSYDEPVSISDAEIGTRVAIKATIQSYVDIKKIRSLTLVTCMAKDGTGNLKLTWFNSPFLKRIFHIGQTYVFVGVLSVNNHQLTIEHPEYYSVSQYEKQLASLQPVYPLTSGLSNKMVTKTIELALSCINQIKNRVPEEICDKYDLLPLAEAIKGVHFPENYEKLIQCHNRLIFDEFFLFLVQMRMLKDRNVKAKNSYVMSKWNEVEQFIEKLPFELTNGQKTAICEIRKDMTGESVMNRLIQGDVGSGKTVVAEVALLAAAKNGYQAAFMVPTEVLATQHYEDLKKDLESFNIRVELLVGSTTLAKKRKIYTALENGEIDIIIGTHALIQDKVIYSNLALVVTDEQHRFGVRQRAILSEKGNEPHVLVMSATPIPRTLAIIMYGDLDISIIKDMPSSRKVIKNCVVGPKYRPTAYRFMQEQISIGHQIYIICPMVEASESVEAENVIEYKERLSELFPSETIITYLHGKMSPEEKNRIMHDFATKKIDILVSTTVIEVGINNPNATVIMIENAERFGLAQLHQLRGRVGRGEAQSYCIMLCGTERKEAMDRLNILNTSNDGFFIANEDLKLRGPGDFFGVRQSGELMFRLGDIYNNADILKMANEAVVFLEKTSYFLEDNQEHQASNIQL